MTALDDMGLSAAQRAAVLDPSPRVLVAAGAGSGKTRLLVAAVVQALTAEGLPADRLVAVTFTRKAGGELASRVRAALDACDRPDLARALDSAALGTIDALCRRVVKDHALEAGVDPDFTVLKNLEVYARYFAIGKAEARRRAEELLEFVALAGRRHAGIPELSGGMQRRLVVARALINRPELLLLDEPTTGLDPQSRHQVWERLDELKAQGLSILLTTHYMDEAARLCDRLVIMDQGKILVEGAPRELIERHIGADVIEVAEPTEALLELVRLRGLPHDRLTKRLLVYAADGEQFFREVAGRCPAGGCVLRQATLEDVFLKLTGRGLRE